MAKKKHSKSIEKTKKKVLKEIEKSEKKTGIEQKPKVDKTIKIKPTPKDTKKEKAIASKKETIVAAKTRKEKRAEKKLRKKARPLKIRIAIQALKTIFIRIPVTVIIIIIIALLAAKLYLSPATVQSLITTTFNDISTGTISLDVKEFSPYGGFVMENILIRSGKDFNNKKLVEIKKLAFKYSLFPILIGNVRFPEIGIYKPRIYLIEKNGKWNAATLMKPGKKTEEKEKKEEKKKDDKGKPSKEISLPVSVEFLLKFVLDDLRINVDGSKFKSSIEGLTFNLDIDVPPFKKIPLSVNAVNILKTMKISLNPQEKMRVTYKAKEMGIKPPLTLTWKLEFDKTGETPKFNSLFKFGLYSTPIRFKRAYLTPLKFMVSYDMFYNPSLDRLTLNHFGVKFRDRQWIKIAGKVSKVTKSQIIDIKMIKSIIPLKDLRPYYRTFTKDRKNYFNGDISLYPLTIKGTPSDIKVDGAINIRGLYFKNPKMEARVPRFRFGYYIRKIKSTMIVKSKLSIPHFNYTLKKSKSGDNGLELKTDIVAANNFNTVSIKNIGLRLYNPSTKVNAINMGINGNVKMKPSMKGKISINKLRFIKQPLLTMIPERFKKHLTKKVGKLIKQPVDLNLSLNFGLGKTSQRAIVNMLIKAPDFYLTDLKIHANVLNDARKKRATLKKFKISSRALSLNIDAKGNVDLKKPPFSDSDLKFSIKIQNREMKKIYGPWNIGGLLSVNAFMKGDLKTGRAWGSVDIDKFNVSNKPAYLSVKDVNMNFPFEYDFKTRLKGKSAIAVNKKQVIDSDNFKDKTNFTIKSIKAKHPARKMSFEFIKDFAASMKFTGNVFRISRLKAYLLDGSLYGRNILFNLSNFKSQNMEFNLILDITNIDIGKLDDPDPKKKTRDGELSLNASFSGKGVNIKKELTARGYVNIYKIGEKFANKLMKGLSKEKGESKLGIIQPLVDNFMIPKGFNFNLDKGLVYATVTFDRKVMSYILANTKIENNKVQFDRMPIQQYLKNILKGE